MTVDSAPEPSASATPHDSFAIALADEPLERRIFFLRGIKIMFDRDLARLYGVPTKVLNQAVRRNIERFPPDFAFQLTAEETFEWKSQIVTSTGDRKGLRKSPWAFSEYGIAMLSSVLHSDRAIQVNIAIMRAFSRLRESVTLYATLARRLDALEQRYDGQFARVFDAVRELMRSQEGPALPTLHQRPPGSNK
jgi:hypothetical protein